MNKDDKMNTVETMPAHNFDVNTMANKIKAADILTEFRDDYFAEFDMEYLDRVGVFDEDREYVQNAVNKALTKAIKRLLK